MRSHLSVTLFSALILFFNFTVAHAADARALDSTSEATLRLAQPGEDVVLHGGTAASTLARESAGPDTFALYGGPDRAPEGRFEDGMGIPDLQGWVGVDGTDQPVFWQISEFNASNLNGNGAGNNAYWCGLDAGQVSGWANASGYGNGWNSVLEFRQPVSNPSTGQTVSLDFYFNHDTEPGYDYFEVEYDSAGQSITLLSLDGSNKDAGNVFNAPGERFSVVKTGDIVYSGDDYSYSGVDEIVIRMRFHSDGAWSDEDGLWPTTGGAVQVDDISLTTSEGSFTEGFEGSPPFLFEANKTPFAGDFLAAYPRINDLDPCRENFSPVIGFIDFGQEPPNGPGVNGSASTGGSTSLNWSYGINGGFVTNYTGGLSFGLVSLENQAWSPEIDWDLPGSADDDFEVAGAKFRFSSWDHLPLINGMFRVWYVRSKPVNGEWTEWRSRNFVYYGGGVPGWANQDIDVTDLLEPDPEKVQVSLGVIDLALDFGFPGTDATPSPVFDNVGVSKFRIGGPALSHRGIDIANDGFPNNGSIDVSTEAARDALDIRFDMANDINSNDLINTPGDSILVDAIAVLPGSFVTDVRLKWALRRNPLFDSVRTPPAGPQDQNFQSVGQVWTGEVVAAEVITSAGSIINGRYQADLPDQDFLYPGDLLHYYFEATDDGGRTTTIPANTAGFGNWDFLGVSNYSRTYTVRGLPTIIDASGSQPRVLVYNDFGRRGNEVVIGSAFGQLGLVEGSDYDTYTTQSPSSGVGNGIGSAGAHGATPDQLAGYHSIFMFAGNLSSFLFSNGRVDKGNDVATLTGFKNLPGSRNTVYFGDYIVSGAVSVYDNPEAAVYAQTIMGVELERYSVRDEIGGQTAPVVFSLVSAFDTDFVAFGGCPVFNEFDSIRPRTGASRVHVFEGPTPGTYYPGPAASVVYERLDGGDRKVDVTFPFGFSSIYPVLSRSVPGASVRTALLAELYGLLGIGIAVPVGVNPSSPREVSFAAAPNPFNPRTQLRFAAPAGQRVRIDVYDLRGRHVAKVFEGEANGAEQTIAWDASEQASGVYLAKFVSGRTTRMEKVALVK